MKTETKRRISVRVKPEVREFYDKLSVDNKQKFTTAVEWALELYMYEYLTTQRK
jgi:hypothetical protein